MSQTTAKTWCLRLLPVLVFFISFVIYYYFYAILRSFGGPSKNLSSSKSLCGGWLTQKKWESLNFNISRQTQLFLKLEDFFWREHLSTLPLPYGIKGSELLLLKVLAISSNYHVPAKIENLECRTCAVIGNGFAIKNSSLGSIINKHDVVIRLNDAPVRGYEEDVGNKTTMRFFYPESASYNPALHNDPDTLMVLVPFKQQDLRWLKEIIYDEKRVRKGFWKPPPQIWLGDVSKIRVLDPHFLLQTADKLLKILSSQKGKQRYILIDFPVTYADGGSREPIFALVTADTVTRGCYSFGLQCKHKWLVNKRNEQWEDGDPTGSQQAHPTGPLQHLHILCVAPEMTHVLRLNVAGQLWTWSAHVLGTKGPGLGPSVLDLRILINPNMGGKVSVHPTTGILAVYVALNYCDVVHIAGFGYPSSNNPRQPIHYYGYDTMKSMKNSYHDLNHEAKALKKLEDSGAIFYLHPHL